MRFQLVPSVLFYSGNDRWYCRDNKSFDRRELGPLAQLVEQFAFNELVAGSNPARPTISKPLFMWGFFLPRMSRMGRTDSFALPVRKLLSSRWLSAGILHLERRGVPTGG
jgi:hypothetical protein